MPGEKEEHKTKKPIETTVKEIAKRLGTTGEELRGKDRRWVVPRSGQRRQPTGRP
jgi:hypothetical protein